MISLRHAQILSLSDSGQHPDAISSVLSVPISTVYSVLRRERPRRRRKPRPRTSDLPRRIQGLASHGIKPGRIAELLEVSRAYCYKVLKSLEKEPRL